MSRPRWTFRALVAVAAAGALLQWAASAPLAGRLSARRPAPRSCWSSTRPAANPFGRYLGEILRAEGFNAYQIADLADVTGPYLASFPLVVLSRGAAEPGPGDAVRRLRQPAAAR